MNNADINADGSYLGTPLMTTISKGRRDVFNLLLDKGANIRGALRIACWEGDLDIIRTLIDNGADINERRFDGQTPLFLAVADHRPEVVKILLSNGADVNLKDDNGSTALIEASKRSFLQKKDLESIKLMLENSANVNIKDEEGCTALTWASRKGHDDLYKIFMSY